MKYLRQQDLVKALLTAQEIKVNPYYCRILLLFNLESKTYHVLIISSEMYFMGTGNHLH